MFFGVGGVILIIVLLVVAVVFIFSTIKINGLDLRIRDISSEMDGSLWDRAFQLTKLVNIINTKGIQHGIEVIDINTFGLGMTPLLQATNSEKLDRADEKLRDLIVEHPELKENPEFSEHLAKFNLSRNELFKNSLDYNKQTNRYNSLINTFPINAVAAFLKKRDKGLFGYYFRELGTKD